MPGKPSKYRYDIYTDAQPDAPFLADQGPLYLLLDNCAPTIALPLARQLRARGWRVDVREVPLERDAGSSWRGRLRP